MRGPRTTMKSGLCFPQLEKALAQKRRRNTAKNKNIFLKKRYLLGLPTSQSSTEEGSAFKLILVTLGGILSSLAVGWKLLSVLCCAGPSIRQLTARQLLHHSKNQEEPERLQARRSRSTATSSHHFCCIIFIRGKASPHAREGDYYLRA